MEIAVSTIQATHERETFELHHLTDTHMDDHDFAEKELDERIEHIKNTPNALWIGGGDYHSLILPNDPRFQTGGQIVHRLPDVYVESVSEWFMPIRDKCVGFATGNHEATIGKHYHRGVGAEVARNLNVDELYLGYRGWCVLRFQLRKRIVTMKAYQYHGWSSGRLKGRKALQAERDLGAWNADAFFLGHDHQPYSDLWWTEDVRANKGGHQIVQRPRAYINGGSWTYGQRPPESAARKISRKVSEIPNESWVEGKNFRPQPPSSPVLYVHVDFGSAAIARDDGVRQGRSAGIDFTIEQHGKRYHL